MRWSLSLQDFVVLGLCLVGGTDAQGEPDARGKTPYDYVNPLIGTTNGGN